MTLLSHFVPSLLWDRDREREREREAKITLSQPTGHSGQHDVRPHFIELKKNARRVLGSRHPDNILRRNYRGSSRVLATKKFALAFRVPSLVTHTPPPLPLPLPMPFRPTPTLLHWKTAREQQGRLVSSIQRLAYVTVW